MLTTTDAKKAKVPKSRAMLISGVWKRKEVAV
jgi:hypothetical protein